MTPLLPRRSNTLASIAFHLISVGGITVKPKYFMKNVFQFIRKFSLALYLNSLSSNALNIHIRKNVKGLKR